jgi:hypothetical protein
MAEITPQALAEVREALERYEKEVETSKLQPNSQYTYLLHAQNFVRWLAGDFTPGGTL